LDAATRHARHDTVQCHCTSYQSDWLDYVDFMCLVYRLHEFVFRILLNLQAQVSAKTYARTHTHTRKHTALV